MLFCGGSTNVIKLYHQTETDEEINFYDYTSLYPWANKNGKYPISHPVIIFEPGHKDIIQYFGLAQCTLLSPHGLYHPVLTLRQNGKQTFPLCRTCVDEEMRKPMLEQSCLPSHRRTVTDHRHVVYS